VKKLGKDYNIDRIILFGSMAVGKPNKDSDIDLVIVSKDFEGMNRIQRGASMYNYWPWLIPVDFLCYTPEEFESLKSRVSIVKEAVDSGILIHS